MLETFFNTLKMKDRNYTAITLKIYFYLLKFYMDYAAKRYFIIDEQIARHFVHYSECLNLPPLLFYVTQIINQFLTSWISAYHDKGLGF